MTSLVQHRMDDEISYKKHYYQINFTQELSKSECVIAFLLLHTKS